MYTWKKHAEYKNAGWEVNFPNGELVAICVYRKGAIALCSLLNNYKKEV